MATSHPNAAARLVCSIVSAVDSAAVPAITSFPGPAAWRADLAQLKRLHSIEVAALRRWNR